MAKFFKRCRLYLAILIITAALLTSLLRALTPFVAQYQTDIEKYLSKLLGQDVVIARMETGMYWFEPVIKLTDLAIFNNQHAVLDAHQLIVGINLFRSLWHWQIEPGVLYVDKVHLKVHQQGHHWRVEGFNNLTSQGSLWTLSNKMPMISWILAQQKLIFKNISADVYLNNGKVISIKQFNLIIAKHLGRYQLKGDINIKQVKPTLLRVLADVSLDPKALENTSGEVYIDGHDVQLSFWQELIKGQRFQVQDGLVNGRVWLTLALGNLVAVQSNVALQSLDVLDTQQKKHFRTDHLKGNWAWEKKSAGWQLSADHLELALNGKPWPMNEFKLDYVAAAQAWTIYVKHVLLDSLLTQDVSWPQALKTFIQAKPQGLLQETQINIKNKTMDSVVSHFSRLGWHAVANYPRVENLSGVIYWQPLQGRLELDGQNTIIKLKDKPKVNFQDLNIDVAWNWNALNYGWQVNLDRFILRHPDMLASLTGSTFFEEKSLPNKLDLKPMISVIPPWRGENILVSQLVPISSRSLSTWPHSVDSSHFEPLIDLKGAVSLTNAEFWMQYLPKQYLKPKLDRWLKHGIKRIDRLVAEVNVAGNQHDFPFDKPSFAGSPGVFEINAHVSGMDLTFAPHWPLTRDIEADLHLNQRILTADVLYAKLQDIRVDQVNLSVNDLGLDHETLLVHGKVRTTGEKALTYVLASPLVKKLPLLSLFKIEGMLDLDLNLEAPLYPHNDKLLTKGELTFHDNALLVNHQLSQVQLGNVAGVLAFNQEGVLDSDLKANLLDAPVLIEIQSIHKPKPATLVNIKGELPMAPLRKKFPSSFLSSLQGSLVLDSELRITNDPGDLEHAQIKSSLKGLEIKLSPPLGKLADEQKPLTVDLDFNPDRSMSVKMKYADLLINAIKSFNGDWSIDLREASIAGKMHYQPLARKLTGQLSKLYLQQDNKGFSTVTFNVGDLPNIDMQIQDFRYGSWDIGFVDCKATSKVTQWYVDYCKIKSPYYFIQAQGEWSQKNAVSKTTAEMNMTISDLGKTLARWGVTPAVDARHGEIQWSGAWPGGFQDFSLEKIIGQALIVFRNGEITHLDAATEEKLGLGKLLSILSLQTLPRRLKLDFSDLVHKGYAFDAFRGNFVIARGIMQTSDSVIDGPTASASINGNLDIVKQLYDLKIKIAPHLTSSLPIVATIAGGPVVGAATWVASKIINQGMQKFSAYGYKITGPWKKPMIKPMDVFKDWDKKLLGIDLI